MNYTSTRGISTECEASAYAIKTGLAKDGGLFMPETIPSLDKREIEELIAQRAAAKKAKNFAEADRIRAYLAERGVTLKDSSQGTTYERA